jgi:hypothetical protein
MISHEAVWGSHSLATYSAGASRASSSADLDFQTNSVERRRESLAPVARVDALAEGSESAFAMGVRAAPAVISAVATHAPTSALPIGPQTATSSYRSASTPAVDPPQWRLTSQPQRGYPNT